MGTDIVLFTRDLRLTDNPLLAAAAEAGKVVPLFVQDPAAEHSAVRSNFLIDCLHDLDSALRDRGGQLVLRRGDTVEQVCRLARDVNAATVHVAGDVSLFARRREARLEADLGQQRRTLRIHRCVHTVVEPGAVTPSGADHYAVYTPYWRRWTDAPRRDLSRAVRHVDVPEVSSERLPARQHGGATSGCAAAFRGGETEGRRRMTAWLARGLPDYAGRRDVFAADGTSRLSPYLHFGCISATELAHLVDKHGHAEDFLRQLAWRDFHHQVLRHDPRLNQRDYRQRDVEWREDAEALHAWSVGETGYPLVDAGIRQLLAEGWMHNRARMVTASFLTKTLGLDWRPGAAHFYRHLVDGDVANNVMNWQWVAGTGTDSRPNRRLSPVRQAERFDPEARYIKRWVPELAELPAAYAIAPWRLGAGERPTAYPSPIVQPPGSSRG